jgi:gamma-glutamyltranspeptidase
MKIKSKSLKKYTALVPKTLRATKNIKNTTIKRFSYFLKQSGKTVKNTAKFLNKQTAKTLRSLTKRRSRK